MKKLHTMYDTDFEKIVIVWFLQIFELQKKPVFSTGMGRVATLQDPTPLRALIEK